MLIWLLLVGAALILTNLPALMLHWLLMITTRIRR